MSLAAWIVLGALNAGSEVIDVLTGDLQAPIWEPVTWEFSSTLVISLLAPFVIEFALRVWIATVGAAVAATATGFPTASPSTRSSSVPLVPARSHSPRTAGSDLRSPFNWGPHGGRA